MRSVRREGLGLDPQQFTDVGNGKRVVGLRREDDERIVDCALEDASNLPSGDDWRGIAHALGLDFASDL